MASRFVKYQELATGVAAISFVEGIVTRTVAWLGLGGLGFYCVAVWRAYDSTRKEPGPSKT